MRVLALTHRTPFPPDKGDKIRTHHLLTRLAARDEVHLRAFAEPPSDMVHASRLARHFASVELLPLDLRVQRLRALPWVLTPSPLTLPVFRRRAMFDAVTRAVQTLRPDVVFAESTSMAPYALEHRTIPWVMDFVDADSAKWRAYAEKASTIERVVYLREALTLARFERRVAEAARISLVTAERERALLRAIAPGCDIRTLPNGVDLEHFTPRTTSPKTPSAVFFGAMDYHANVEAAVFLVREVLPRLRRCYPGFQMTLAGSNPTPEVRALGAEPGVTVTGYVTDIRPYVQGATLCVIPLRVARGVQNKVLEAMAMGVPVVVSPSAAEGIDATPGRDLLVARVDDGGTALTDAVTSLLDAPERMATMATNARHTVESRYGWEPRAQELHDLCKEAAHR